MDKALRPDAVAIITGAASGIGAELARALHGRGMNLLLSDISEASLAALGSELSCEYQVADVSNAEAVLALASRAQRMGNPIGAVFANAGVMKTTALDRTSDADWRFMIGVNIMGVANMMRAFVPLLKQQSSNSRFVATASVAGLVSAPMSGAYNATKHAVVSMCETLHQELREKYAHVGVSVICPGAVKTDILNLEKYDTAPENEKFHEAMKKLMAEKGLSAQELVTISLEQLDDEKFWIFPQKYVFDRFQARSEAIFNHSDPEWLPKT